MTTWTTFETIDETPRFTEFFIDRLGCHSYIKDDRTRFHLVRGTQPEEHRTDWVVWDLECEDDQKENHAGSMRDCIQWVSGRVLYGA
mgnify:CR=1 FL=1